jgi:ectoine hydroxylase-related dioxygenase (phytanoyl-CoA dioxygenase family)
MDWPEALARDGFARWPKRLSEPSLVHLESLIQVEGAFSRRPLPSALLQTWLSETEIPHAIASILGGSPRVIRAFYLDKSEQENWALAFHQDTTLSFVEPKDVEGFSAWVNKAHFFQAQAPATLMAQMLSMRIHLDDNAKEQGALKVIPATHELGKMDDTAISALTKEREAVILPAQRGEMIFMRPLLLHGSDRATDPSQRRVLHLEWAAFDAPSGLRWAWF